MKSHLRVLSLALFTLPVCLNAATAQDMKQSYQSAQEQNERSAELIPAGTIVPVTLNSNLRSDKSETGAAITATIMQDVPLGAGNTLRAGSKVTGHVIEAVTPGRGSDGSRISFQFDQIHFGNETVPITASLRALASVMEVYAVQVPKSGGTEDYSGYWSSDRIGGDQVSYGLGTYTSQGVSAGGMLPQALWLFSANAFGTYGFGNLQIAHTGLTEPADEVTLTSNRKVLKVGKGSAMLLRVDSSRSEDAKARTTISPAMAQ
ncbi:MAG: hypothetical protein WBZ01_13090 [Terriglobales bacterium]|jgi:hypothetical protein